MWNKFNFSIAKDQAYQLGCWRINGLRCSIRVSDLICLCIEIFPFFFVEKIMNKNHRKKNFVVNTVLYGLLWFAIGASWKLIPSIESIQALKQNSIHCYWTNMETSAKWNQNKTKHSQCSTPDSMIWMDGIDVETVSIEWITRKWSNHLLQWQYLIHILCE